MTRDDDIVGRFLDALRTLTPPPGRRLDVMDSTPLEEELGETLTVSIYGQCSRADLARVLRELVAD